MTNVHLFYKPRRNTDLSFDDLYEDISWDWQHKSDDLQARRWHALKQSNKGERYASR